MSLLENEFSIGFDGSLKIGNEVIGSPSVRAKTDFINRVSSFIDGHRDHGNGYEWIYLKGLTFGGQPCGASACFRNAELCQAAWSVSLPAQELEAGWPTRRAIDAEIAFVRGELTNAIGKNFAVGQISFDWGVIWSDFDSRAFMASSGLRYIDS